MSLPAGYWVLAVIGALGELGPLTGGRRQRGGVYLSICTSLAILLVWGFLPALAAQAAASVVAAARSRLAPASAGLLFARTTAATVVAAGVATVSGLGTVRRSQGIDRSVLVELLATILSWLVAYYAPLIVVERWLQRETWQTIFRRGLGADVLTSGALLFLAPVVVAEPRGWTFALLALPLLALNQLAGLVNRQAESLRLDRVTGLLNQRGLGDVATELGRRRPREPGRYAVLLVRLHKVRELDDAFGRPIVDAVLAGVARRLDAALGAAATVGRPDTDDLAVLVPRAGKPEGRNPDRIKSAARIVSQVVDEPVVVDGLPYDATATIGIARSPEDADDLASLLREADAAIRSGGPRHDRVVAYRPTPQEEIDRRLGLLTDLRAALIGEAGGGLIDFVYQPQVWLDSGAMVAVEALLRWTHPARGTVKPDDLFQVAEPTPLMHDLTRLAVETVTHQIRRWNDLGIRLQVAVNVSVRDLYQDWFVDELLDRIRGAGIAAEQLVVEITESEIIGDPEQVRRSIGRAAAAGVRVAVDDFGSGFASLQHLRQLTPNQLKIDKGLVRTIADNADDRAVVRSVIELAQALDLTVVAEGVESPEVHRALRELGCQMGQGWYYGRPSPGPEITRLLSTEPRRLRPNGHRSGNQPAERTA